MYRRQVICIGLITQLCMLTKNFIVRPGLFFWAGLLVTSSLRSVIFQGLNDHLVRFIDLKLVLLLAFRTFTSSPANFKAYSICHSLFLLVRHVIFVTQLGLRRIRGIPYFFVCVLG